MSSPSLINTAVNDWLFYRGVAADIVKGRPDKEYQAENQDHQHQLPEQHQQYRQRHCPFTKGRPPPIQVQDFSLKRSSSIHKVGSS